MLREFVINNYISVKLEKGKTNIYVDNSLFKQCKKLILNFNLNYEEVEEIDSVDKAVEYLHKSLNENIPDGIKIDHETEFFGNCSNIQAWVDNNYDTRILHSNLSFPLLKKLVEAKDYKAKRVFKKEIIKRLEANFPPVTLYLIKEGYIDYLTEEEINSLDIDFISCLNI